MSGAEQQPDLTADGLMTPATSTQSIETLVTMVSMSLMVDSSSNILFINKVVEIAKRKIDINQ